MKSPNYLSFILAVFLFWSCNKPEALTLEKDEFPDSKVFEDIMAGSAKGWNEGNLDEHLAIYDSSATFSASKGLISIPALKDNFQKKYFNGTKPKQQLAFADIKVRPLGNSHALITGKFILSGGGEAEQSGRYSLVFGKTPNGWKVLHDHSS